MQPDQHKRDKWMGHEFDGGVAIVAGGSGGIGSAICEALAAAGSNIALTYRSRKDAADGVAAAVEAHGREDAHWCVLCRTGTLGGAR